MLNSKPFKRIVAYIIDIMVVTIIVTALYNLSFLNPNLDKYNEVYDKYTEEVKKYQNDEIKQDEFMEEYKTYNYELQKESLYTDIIFISVYLLYFVGFNYITKGVTLGKKIMKLKIVTNDEKKSNPSIIKYLIRSLIAYSLIFKIILRICICFMDVSTYHTVYNIMYYLQNIVETAIMVMVVIRIDGRGLHDMIAKTVVVSCDELVLSNKEEKDDEENKEKIIDAKYEEIGKKKTKKTKE